MSHQLSNALTEALLDRFSIRRAFAHANVAILLCSVDDDGRPHPAMLSSLELVATDARNIRVALYATSGTAKNLRAQGHVTLVVADHHGVFYIKGDARELRGALVSHPELTAFNMQVRTVLEDSPAAHEGAAVASGIRVRRARVDEARAMALLEELLALA